MRAFDLWLNYRREIISTKVQYYYKLAYCFVRILNVKWLLTSFSTLSMSTSGSSEI